MLFNSVEFLVFLPLVFLAYWAIQPLTHTAAGLKTQNALLLVASYVFYGWWDWRFLSLIALSTAVDWWKRLARCQNTRLLLRRPPPRGRRGGLLLDLVGRRVEPTIPTAMNAVGSTSSPGCRALIFAVAWLSASLSQTLQAQTVDILAADQIVRDPAVTDAQRLLGHVQLGHQDGVLTATPRGGLTTGSLKCLARSGWSTIPRPCSWPTTLV